LIQNLLSDLFDDEILNESYQKLLAGAIDDAMQRLMQELNERFLNSSGPEWERFVQLCMMHPIRELLHQDPFTRRAREKACDCPSDPELLDFVFGDESGTGLPEDTSDLGREIFRYTMQMALCRGLRTWTRKIAEAVDGLAHESDDPAVLSVMAGHMPEGHLTEALKQIGRWVAFDSDASSLQQVRRLYATQGIKTLAGTVRQLLAGTLWPGEFDLVYSTALYSHLPQDTGQRLTTCLFQMLRPGGRLVIANPSSEMPERGYMESFMDWHLICRSRSQVLGLASGIDETGRVSSSEDCHVISLEIKKA
jgi:2-polyprenyl-3-methyl-5-hydroxy-6-metoxy-1,4-benzoquinol methylase